MAFYGRKREIEQLNSFINSDNQQLALIYGRRRIGKSELIKHCIQKLDKICIYYECKQTTEKNNVQSLAEIVAEQLSLPKLAFETIEEVIAFLYEEGMKRRIIIALDEYTYLRSVVKGLDSIIQSLVDKYKEKSELKVILCGSYIDIMKSIVETHNPLYGRVNLIMDLKEMDYLDASLFYGKYSNEDKIRIYSVFGGVPYYNSLIDESVSVEDNIIELVSKKNARLENEISMYLMSELSKIYNANEVFEALSKGYSKYKDILDHTSLSSAPTLVDTINKLISLELVVKEAPINDENNKKKAKYRISDNLSKFYFRYIFPNKSRIAVMNDKVFYDKYIKDDYNTKYVPEVFENICKQFLIRENIDGRLKEDFYKIGKYYYDNPAEKTNGEFDIVTEGDNGYVFYEAKYKSSPIDDKLINEEIKQVEKTNIKCIKYGFFSKSGYRAEKKNNLIFYELEDLYKKNK